MAQLGLWNMAQETPSQLALVDPNGQELSLGELAAASNQIVHGLRALGLKRGDALAAVVQNEAAMVELFLAALQGGFYITPINCHLAPPEIAYIAQDCDAQAVFCSERYGDVCTAALAQIAFPAERRFSSGTLAGFRSFADFKSKQPTTRPTDLASGQAMTYTSGTTGRPKGVRRPLPDVDPDTNAERYAMFLSLFGIKPRDNGVHLVVSPLYHTAVLNFCLNSLHLGHTVVLMDKWTPEGTLERISRYRVTTSHMVPTQFKRLLGLSPEVRATYDVSSLRQMIHSAAPCPVELKQQMLAWWGPTIYEYYAASEGGGTLAIPTEWLAHPGTVGRAWPVSEISILDDQGNALPPGEVGTVYMRMQGSDFEYHKDKQKTDSARIGRLFTVGDAGYLDKDGYLYLCDRKADMIISGGVNIYPAEIELALTTHPKVADVAVFGIPDDDWGEQVKAVIEPASGIDPGPALEDELRAFCKQHLATYKIPRTFDFTQALPRDPNGKLYKRKLRDPYWAGRSKAI
jgi:long-chain acyl-CoA synthetase